MKKSKTNFSSLLLFFGALIAGTLCSLSCKILLTMKGIGMTGKEEIFSTPLFLSFAMFVGMASVLFVHLCVIWSKIPFPGYHHDDMTSIPTKMYFLLLVPTIFDLVSTVLETYGLKYINVSIYQMLRGSSIIFVAMLKQILFNQQLAVHKWYGILCNVIAVVLVGITAFLSAENESSLDLEEESNPFLGVILILGGTFVQSVQFVYEERMLTASEDLPAAPPLLVVGMEGLWGSIICLCVLYPIAFHIEGPDHGSLENLWNSLTILYNTPTIQVMFVLYFTSIFLFNILALLVTFMLDSVWRAILDNFRPISVWIFDLWIFYFITRTFGEPWTIYSWIQLLGLFILLFGTTVYNSATIDSGFPRFFLTMI